MHYYFLHVPPEVNQVPWYERERILEAARKRAGFYLPAYWIALGHGIVLGLAVGCGLFFVATLRLEDAGERAFRWVIPTLLFTTVLINLTLSLLKRWAMRRAVRKLLAEENVVATSMG
jgi:hypothetical protein